MGYRYCFDPYDQIQDLEHLHCMRIHLHESVPTLEGVEQMLTQLYIQRYIKPEMLLMAPQDLEDMSRLFVHENEDKKRFAYTALYFMEKDEKGMFPRHYGREMKRIMHAGGTTFVYPLASLEPRFVIAGFMPVVIDRKYYEPRS